MSIHGHLGFFNTSSSRTHVRFGFSTHVAAGANVAPSTAFEAADIRIYKATDGAALSATQRSSSNGITMTSPFDSLTGVHTVDIDLTDNTDAGFYASNCYYEVWLTPDETVDSQAISVCLCSFEIGAASANIVQLGGDTQSATDLKDFADAGYDPSTNKVQGVVLVDTTTTLTNLPAITAGWLTDAGIAADAFTAAKFAADVTTELQSGLATSTEISALNNLSAADVRTELTTELGLITDLDGRLTLARAGYLDNLNIGGAVASSAQVTGLNVNTRCNLNVPVEIETPDSSTQTYKIRLHLYDLLGNMEAPDSTPTVSLTNAAGTDRSARLSVASNPSTGVYTWDYTATAGDTEEQLVWIFTVVEGGVTRTYPSTSYVVEHTAYRFDSSDRTKLNAIHAKLPSKTYLTGTANSDGDIEMSDATGNFPGTVAGVAGTITTLDALNTSVATNLSSQTTTISNLINTVLNRIGAFTGTGINTILGFFKALMRSDTLPPDDLGGSYHPLLYSNEAIVSRVATVETITTALPSDTEVADAVLSRSVSNVEATAGRHTLASLILHCTEFSISAGVMTVYQTDGVTVFTTTTLSTDPDADPITGAS